MARWVRRNIDFPALLTTSFEGAPVRSSAGYTLSIQHLSLKLLCTSNRRPLTKPGLRIFEIGLVRLTRLQQSVAANLFCRLLTIFGFSSHAFSAQVTQQCELNRDGMVMGALAKNESRAVGRGAALLVVTGNSLTHVHEGNASLPAPGFNPGSNAQIPVHN